MRTCLISDDVTSDGMQFHLSQVYVCKPLAHVAFDIMRLTTTKTDTGGDENPARVGAVAATGIESIFTLAEHADESGAANIKLLLHF